MTGHIHPWAPPAVVMIRPHHFRSNPETMVDNSFQEAGDTGNLSDVAAAAHQEITTAAETLTSHGVTVHLYDDTTTETPDSVFPNNWFSTHPEGRVALYPMCAANRRLERRTDIIADLAARYRVTTVTDFSPAEQDDMFLEGTGALVFDHPSRTVFVARSHRAHQHLIDRFCAEFGYTPVAFDSADADGNAVYHTNVIMCVGSTFAIVGSDMIPDAADRAKVHAALQSLGKEIIEVSADQISEFAGNALELCGTTGSVLAISARAVAALTDQQHKTLAEHTTVVPLQIPTVELAGGSVRCTLAAVHLPPRVSAP